MNNVSLVGRVCADPELKYTQTGSAVTTVRLAVNRDFKNQQTGEYETDFMDVVCWQRTAEFVANNVTKGRQVSVTGRIQVRSYQAADGGKRTAFEIVASNLNLLGPRPGGNGGGEEGQSEAPTGQTAPKTETSLPPDPFEDK